MNKIKWKISLFGQDSMLLEQMITKIKEACISKVINFVVVPLPTKNKYFDIKNSCFTPGRSICRYSLVKLKRVIFITVFNNDESNPINVLRDITILSGIEIRLSKIEDKKAIKS